MEKISSNIVYIVLIIAALVGAFYIGRNSGKNASKPNAEFEPAPRNSVKPEAKKAQSEAKEKPVYSNRAPITRDLNDPDSLLSERENPKN